MPKPKQTGKHQFQPGRNPVTYESTVQADGQRRVDANGTTKTFKFRFVCRKCMAEAEVVRDSKHLKDAQLGNYRNISPPKRGELFRLGIATCNRQRAVREVMES
jgi:hypothetical protein